MDTLFQIVDAELYSQLIDLKDNGEFDYLDGKTYEEMYRDARACVDLCHRDGVIKDEVARNPAKYVVKDPNLVPMLKQYKAKGIKVRPSILLYAANSNTPRLLLGLSRDELPMDLHPGRHVVPRRPLRY